MKKTRLTLFALLLSMVLLAGCGSSMERDANKMAKRIVEMEQVQNRMGDRSNLGGKQMTKQEFEEYSKEYIEYTNKMLEKYGKTPEQKKEFTELVNKKVEELRKK